jgi:hypothetical protein
MVFVSYTHNDRLWVDKAKRHFSPIQKYISFWEDSKILPGDVWDEEIKKSLKKTKVALLMLSADYFNSKYIVEVELPYFFDQAKTKKITILSIILKPFLFEEYPELSKYQAMNSPNNPVVSMIEAEQELFWMKTMLRIKELSSI